MWMSKFREGALKAWETRRRRGWKRESLDEKAKRLVELAKKRGKKRLVKMLQHRYRSKARRRQVIEQAEEVLLGE